MSFLQPMKNSTFVNGCYDHTSLALFNHYLEKFLDELNTHFNFHMKIFQFADDIVTIIVSKNTHVLT